MKVVRLLMSLRNNCEGKVEAGDRFLKECIIGWEGRAKEGSNRVGGKKEVNKGEEYPWVLEETKRRGRGEGEDRKRAGATMCLVVGNYRY